MRRLLGGLLVVVLAVSVGGCSSSMKKGASFVFGPTETGEWLNNDCWNQLDAKDGGKKDAPAESRTK